MSHSLKNFRDPLFLFRKIMFGLFFFSAHFWHDFCFFFFLGKVYLYSLTRLKNVFFFPGTGKKKRVFHTLIRFLPKNPKKQTIPGKKKTLPLVAHIKDSGSLIVIAKSRLLWRPIGAGTNSIFVYAIYIKFDQKNKDFLFSRNFKIRAFFFLKLFNIYYRKFSKCA